MRSDVSVGVTRAATAGGNKVCGTVKAELADKYAVKFATEGTNASESARADIDKAGTGTGLGAETDGCDGLKASADAGRTLSVGEGHGVDLSVGKNRTEPEGGRDEDLSDWPSNRESRVRTALADCGRRADLVPLLVASEATPE